MLAIARRFCLLLSLALFASVAAPTVAQNLLSEQAFTEAFARAIAKRAPSFETREVGPLHLTVRNAEGLEFQAFLDNAYRTYLAQPNALVEIIEAYAARMLEPSPALTDINPARIVPVIQRPAFLSDARAAARRGGSDDRWDPPAYDRYNADLIILYVLDTEHDMRYLSEAQLAESGLSKSDRQARAVENLRALLPDIQAHSQNGYYIVTADGNYESSLLLFDGLWQSGRLPVQGDPVVAIPTRNILIVTGSENRDVIAGLRKFAADAMSSESYPLTDRLFVFREGKFVTIDF